MKKTICFIFLGLILVQSRLYGQSDVPDVVTGYERTAQAGMGFLSLPIGGRAAALAEAFNGVKGDVLSIFYNPAGLSYLENTAFMFSETYWFVDTRLHAAALAYPVKNWGSFGINFISMDYGAFHGTEIDATDPLGWRETGDFEVSEFAFGLSYAKQAITNFSFGLNLKYIHQDLGNSGIYNAATGEREFISSKKGIIAADIGIIYETMFRGIILSMSIRNFGQDVQYQLESFELPLLFRVGVSSTLQELVGFQSDIHAFNISVDAIHPNDWSERIYLGGEYSFMKRFFLRAGYKFNHSSEGLTLGIGVNVPVLSLGKLSVDYAYKNAKDSGFDAVHVVSLSGAL